MEPADSAPAVARECEYLPMSKYPDVLQEQFDYLMQHHTGVRASEAGLPCQECDRSRKIQEMLMIRFR